MEIEVGEYIRTNTGLIDKVIKYITEDDTFPYDAFDYMGEFVAYSEAEIVKHSKNIIDLIEAGDIITYNKDFVITSKIVESVGEKCVYAGYPDSIKIYENELVDILTKEMYEQNCYKIGD